MCEMPPELSLKATGVLGVAAAPVARVRPLYGWEIEEARRVFSDKLSYDRIRIHEGAGWTDAPRAVGSSRGATPAFSMAARLEAYSSRQSIPFMRVLYQAIAW